MTFGRTLVMLVIGPLAAIGCGDNSAGIDDPDAPPASIDAPALPDAATRQAVTIDFAARVNGAAFACGTTYPGTGASGADYVGTDFRFYVHSVRLTGTGADIPVELDVNDWQAAEGIGLLDFETGGSGCQMGTTATHTALTGTVPFGTVSDGIAFTIGVPFEQNHLDASTAVAPMNVPGMFWAWSSGYKFIKADGAIGVQGFNLHVGSTGCAATGSTPPTEPCVNPNSIDIDLPSFTPGTSVIVADIGHVIADEDLTINTPMTAPGCMSFPGDPECDTIFPKLGLAYEGAPAEPQAFVTVE
jgi:uncharacterized repeat protein (TIGR04052 family)